MTTEKSEFLWTAPFFAYLLNLALKGTVTCECFFTIPSHTEYKMRISKKLDFGRTLATFRVLEEWIKIFQQLFQPHEMAYYIRALREQNAILIFSLPHRKI